MNIKHAPAIMAVMALGLGASGCTHVKNMFHKDSAPASETSAPAPDTSAPADTTTPAPSGATP